MKEETRRIRFDPKNFNSVFTLLHFIFYIPHAALSLLLYLLDATGRSLVSNSYIQELYQLQKPNTWEPSQPCDESIVEKWMKEPKNNPTVYKRYTLSELLQTILCVSLYGSFMKFGARLFRRKLHGNEREKLLFFIRLNLQKSQHRLKNCEFIKGNFAGLKEFLYDVDSMNQEQFGRFVDHVTDCFIEQPSTWFMEYIHSRLWLSSAARVIFDGTLSVNSLLLPENTHFTQLLLSDLCSFRAKIYTGGLRVVHFAVIERTVLLKELPPKYERPEKRANAVELLKCFWSGTYIRFVAGFFIADPTYARDLHMIEIGIMCGHKVLFSDWSNELLHRGLWAVQEGRRFLTEDSYNVLLSETRKTTPDFTTFDTCQVLAFVFAGVCNFRESGISFWDIIGSPDAPIMITHQPPRLTLGHLVKVGVVKKVGRDFYAVPKLPWPATSLKMVTKNGLLSVMKSPNTVKFKANLEQIVC